MPIVLKDQSAPAAPAAVRRLAVVGNPNCGKTTLFNALTGLRQKVGNYPGVTVEKKEGIIKVAGSAEIRLIDLPGLYSLTPRSPDETIARDVLLGRRAETSPPDGIVNIVDASNLERNLYLTSQLLELGLPMIVVLTMTDVALKSGRTINEEALSEALGVPVVSVVVQNKTGLETLPAAIAALPTTLADPRPLQYELPEEMLSVAIELADMILAENPAISLGRAYSEAVSLLMAETILSEEARRYSQPILAHAAADKAAFARKEIDFASALVEARYAWIEALTKRVTRIIATHPEQGAYPGTSMSERVDRILLHRFWGYVIFFAVMMLIFQAVFTWALVPMGWINSGIGWLSSHVEHIMPPGALRDLLVDGVMGGVGTTISFLPQILILFFFIGLLEDTGYLARAAFLMDKLMANVGLHGKSFIPMLSSFACAIPGIMATRTIDDRKSRLVTILIAPLMSCSARLPVYTLMIGAFIARRWQGVTMMAMYLAGTFAAFGMAWVFKKTLLRSAPPRFFIELPPYHLPAPRTVLMQMLERTLLFLRRAGTVIFAVSAVLWWLSSYPRHVNLPPSEQLAHSYAGMMGRAIEPAIKPLGFDWRIGVSLVSSFVAREVFVSSMGTIYSVGTRDTDPDEVAQRLQTQLRHDPYFSPLLAICIMIYYVLAMQCLSTVAVVYRETNGWKWPLFQLGYMTALAWVATFLVWHIGNALRLGIH